MEHIKVSRYSGAQRFNLSPQVAEETYGVVLQTLTDDGTISQSVLQEQLEQLKREVGVKKEISVSATVDYRMLREVAKEMER